MSFLIISIHFWKLQTLQQTSLPQQLLPLILVHNCFFFNGVPGYLYLYWPYLSPRSEKSAYMSIKLCIGRQPHKLNSCLASHTFWCWHYLVLTFFVLTPSGSGMDIRWDPVTKMMTCYHQFVVLDLFKATQFLVRGVWVQCDVQENGQIFRRNFANFRVFKNG